jgi:hypothetical protein
MGSVAILILDVHGGVPAGPINGVVGAVLEANSRTSRQDYFEVRTGPYVLDQTFTKDREPGHPRDVESYDVVYNQLGDGPGGELRLGFRTKAEREVYLAAVKVAEERSE